MTRHLLRFDDVCPTMNWEIWDRIEEALDAASAKPIVAIVPDNADPNLQVAPPREDFWERARAWQRKGWVIGQHGYRHLYDSREPGLVPWWRQSEFAGHGREVQLERMRKGRERLESEGLTPVIWVAPSHSFDATTLDVLREVGIGAVSDGFGFRPYRDRRGLVWIPQRPWEPAVRARGGTSTECVHPNTLRSVDWLTRYLRLHRDSMMGVAFEFADLLADARAKTPADAASEWIFTRYLFTRRLAKRILVRPRAAA